MSDVIVDYCGVAADNSEGKLRWVGPVTRVTRNVIFQGSEEFGKPII